MNWNMIFILLKHELLLLLRDRRTVILSIMLPLVLMPISLYASQYSIERQRQAVQKATFRYAIIGSQGKDVRAALNKTLAARAATAQGDQPRYEEVQISAPEERLKNGDIQAYIEALSAAEAAALPVEPGKEAKAAARKPGLPLVKIYYRANRDNSRAAGSGLRALLEESNLTTRNQALRDKGLPIDAKDLFTVEEKSLASAGQVTGSMIGRFLTLFLVMLMLTGGAIAAMDIIAGEKERGTIETILTTAVSRSEIVAAKQLAITAVALFITFLQIANMLVYLTFKVIKLPGDFVIDVPPLTIAVLVALFIPLAALIGAVLLMISGYARSYKEAQQYFFPVYLLSLVPAAAGLVPAIRLRSVIAIVPLANVSVAVREVMVGKYDWLMLTVTFVVMMAAAVLMVRASARMLSEERLITSNESGSAEFEGSQAVYAQHVYRWYIAMWALLFLAVSAIPQLGTLRRQLFFNQLVIFLLIPLVIVWKYRLNIREALSLRGVRPVAWLAVLLAVPAGQIVSNGIFRLADKVMPVPRQMLEQMSSQLMPADMPTWQLFFFIAVLPGICEEIAFRGTLLYGLRRKLKPVTLALVVGLIFGIFHFDLFRILPTAFMGVYLSGIAILTGSIFPCMLAHMANNAIAVVLARENVPLQGLSWWVYVAATIIFVLCFYILYRSRESERAVPVPEVRSSAAA